MPAITLKNVTYQYPNADRAVINGLNLSIAANQWTAIIGQNGSGKSTIIRLIDGLLQAKSGTIMVNSLVVNEANLPKIHQQIGIVFQNPDNQFVGTTVADDVAFGLENRQVPRAKMRQIIPQVLSEVGMAEYAQSQPDQLSGGQKQRVAIAGILALHPQIILLDEATSMLDPAGRRTILKLLTRLRNKYHFTIISITHDPREMELADQLLIINAGQAVAQGPTAEILNNQQLLEQTGVGIPVSQRLRWLLAKRGIKVPRQYLTTEKMVNWLWQQLQ